MTLPSDSGPDFTPSARRLGIASAVGVVGMGVAYLVCLVIGLALLPSPDDPIQDPWFTALEILILALVPCMVVLMLSVQAWAHRERKVLGLAAVLFMVMVAVTTSAVHFAILSLSRQEALREMLWLFSFRWPSVVYALDILAWDVFFPLSVLCAAALFGHVGLQGWIRALLVVSGGLALAGVAGVFLDDMRVRNVGVVGYAVVFPAAAALIGILFRSTEPVAHPPAAGASGAPDAPGGP